MKPSVIYRSNGFQPLCCQPLAMDIYIYDVTGCFMKYKAHYGGRALMGNPGLQYLT